MKNLLSLVMILCPVLLFGQLRGLVQGKQEEKTNPVVGAKIRLLKAKTGVSTNSEGTFSLVLPKDLPDTAIVSAYGFYNDTLVLTKKDRFLSVNILLYSKTYLKEVVLKTRKKSNSILRMKTLHVEELTSTDLRKAACCNLSESFETNASVDVNITDAVSGAKKIQMMGLDGVYTQLQLENIPFLRGIESSFGLKSLPGTWIESIQITKGTGSVVNGFESMAGLVNMEIKKPATMERFYLNAYQNIFGRSEINLNAGQQLNKKWDMGWLAHASSTYRKMDGNSDGFLDQPVGENFALMNRFDYHGEKMEGKIGINAYVDKKVGGQSGFERSMANSTNPSSLPYGVVIDSKHADAFAKTGFFGKKPLQSVGIIYHVKFHELNGQFGPRTFNGLEKRANVNVLYEDYISTSDHKLKSGINFSYIDIQQKLRGLSIADSLEQNRTEYIPGIFSEYTFTSSRWSVVAGVRGDYHNLFGFKFTPRIHAKYILDEYTDVRFTAGSGWRVPNYIMDNISLLANSKTWYFNGTSKPEDSWNIGGSIAKRFALWNKTGDLTCDFYHTRFNNQLVVDRDSVNNGIVFKNLENASFSNSFQVELSFDVLKNLSLRFAYKYLDVRSIFAGTSRSQVMLPKHRGFSNFSYITRNKKWEYDLTYTVFGSSRLPAVVDASGIPNYNEQSSVFSILNSQITYIHKSWEYYLGGENLTNYQQSDPILDSVNPFGTEFDATRIWAPIMGINVYVGVRYSLKSKK